MVQINFAQVQLKTKQEGIKTLVFDPIRKRWFILTPEEHVRQYLIYYLLHTMNYPAGMLSVEKQILVGGMAKRFDIVIYDREHKPWMLVECKAPEINISENTLHQLLNYQRTAQCNYWLLSNGHQTFCADSCDIHDIKWLTNLPSYNF